MTAKAYSVDRPTRMSSPKLFALHNRLLLPSAFSEETLAKCLTDATYDPRNGNQGLAAHGEILVDYHVTKVMLARYPRLPIAVLKAGVKGYAGSTPLAAIGRAWGVEVADVEGVDGMTGQLLLKRVARESQETRRRAVQGRRGAENEQNQGQVQTVPLAYAKMVRAVVAGLQLHSGDKAAREFIDKHLLSRQLDLHKTFTVNEPQRELGFLCGRLGIERPITRLLAETGRKTNSPVFVVGVYSGQEQLGEGQASSLREAEFLVRTSLNVLRAAY